MRQWINMLESYGTGTFYHVTEKTVADDIITNGFMGGWGDVGFGVYLYDNLDVARDYAERGGWDAGLEDPVIVKISTPYSDVAQVPVMSAEWDASLYKNMWWHDMEDDQDDDDARWHPETEIVR